MGFCCRFAPEPRGGVPSWDSMGFCCPCDEFLAFCTFACRFFSLSLFVCALRMGYDAMYPIMPPGCRLRADGTPSSVDWSWAAWSWEAPITVVPAACACMFMWMTAVDSWLRWMDDMADACIAAVCASVRAFSRFAFTSRLAAADFRRCSGAGAGVGASTPFDDTTAFRASRLALKAASLPDTGLPLASRPNCSGLQNARARA